MRLFEGIRRLACILLLITVSAPRALAGTILYKPTSGSGRVYITGETETSKIGELKLKDSSVVFTSNIVDVVSPDCADGDRSLSGTAFRITTDNKGRRSNIEGYAFFHKGQIISKLDRPDCKDTVILNDGTVYSGRIKKVNSEEMLIATIDGVKVASTPRIENVSSPRVYKFEITSRADELIEEGQPFQASTRRTTFTPTRKNKIAFLPKVGRKWTDLPKGKKIAIATAGALLVATAIAVPIAVAVPLANKSKRRRIPTYAEHVLAKTGRHLGPGSHSEAEHFILIHSHLNEHGSRLLPTPLHVKNFFVFHSFAQRIPRLNSFRQNSARPVGANEYAGMEYQSFLTTGPWISL